MQLAPPSFDKEASRFGNLPVSVATSCFTGLGACKKQVQLTAAVPALPFLPALLIPLLSQASFSPGEGEMEKVFGASP